MNKQKLNEVIGEGVVILFDSKTDFICFLKEIQSYGGKWQNREDIVIPKVEDVQFYFRVYIQKNYRISFVSGICFHNINFRSIKFSEIG